MRLNFSKHFILTSLGTLLSRIAGLFRDIYLSLVFGTSGVLSVFLTIYAFINLPRKFFGEGSTNSIIIPQTSTHLDKSEQEAYKYSSNILTNISLIVSALIVLASLICLGVIYFYPAKQLTFILTLALLPYALFICISAMLSGFLNIKKEFFFPSISSIITNIGIIIFCALISPFINNLDYKIIFLTLVVTFTGVLQSGLLFLRLKRIKWKFQFYCDYKTKSWEKFKTLFVPVFFSAILLNLSIYIDRGLAWALSENSVSALYFAERVVYLPVGLFAVALATSTLPKMSKNFAQLKLNEAQRLLQGAITQILTLAMPAMIFFLFYQQEIIQTLFFRGKFDSYSLQLTLKALSFYLWGIPAFCLVKIITNVYYSSHNTKDPLYAGIIAVVGNLLVSLLLLRYLEEGAIALGTAVSAYISLFYLMIKMPKNVRFLIFGQILIQCFAMGICSFGIFSFLSEQFIFPRATSTKVIYLLSIAVIGFLINLSIVKVLSKVYTFVFKK